MTDDENYSYGIRFLGYDTVLAHVRAVVDSKLPIISVGSGDGAVERRLAGDLKTDIICVDPKSRKDADYPTVQALIKTRPEVVGNCVLFCNWPLPNGSDYDIRALVDLNPVHAVYVFDPTGIAGGRRFRHYASTLGVENCGKWMGVSEEFKEEGKETAAFPKGYEIAYQTKCTGRDMFNETVVITALTITRDRGKVAKAEIPAEVVGGFQITGVCVVQ